MKLLVDHNLPWRLAVALDAVFGDEHMIIALSHKFGRSDLADEDWIRELGREGGWAVLSGDINIAKKKPLRDQLIGAGMVGFFFSPSMNKWSLARRCARVLTIWPQMISHMNTSANGVFELRAKGMKFPTIGR